jgi:hypothetical protein
LIGGSLPYLVSPITNIETIGGLTELRTLLISSFPVNNLAFVAKLMNLEELNVSQMPISSIEAVRDLKSLKKVSLNLTAVADISPLLDLPALTELTVGRTPARSDLLKSLKKLSIIIEQQQNFNLDAVGVLTSLELLWIWAPNGGELDVAPLRSLANLRSLKMRQVDKSRNLWGTDLQLT